MFPARRNLGSLRSLWGLVPYGALGSSAAPSCSIHKNLQAFHGGCFWVLLVCLGEGGVGEEWEVIWPGFF